MQQQQQPRSKSSTSPQQTDPFRPPGPNIQRSPQPSNRPPSQPAQAPLAELMTPARDLSPTESGTVGSTRPASRSQQLRRDDDHPRSAAASAIHAGSYPSTNAESDADASGRRYAQDAPAVVGSNHGYSRHNSGNYGTSDDSSSYHRGGEEQGSLQRSGSHSRAHRQAPADGSVRQADLTAASVGAAAAAAAAAPTSALRSNSRQREDDPELSSSSHSIVEPPSAMSSSPASQVPTPTAHGHHAVPHIRKSAMKPGSRPTSPPAASAPGAGNNSSSSFSLSKGSRKGQPSDGRQLRSSASGDISPQGSDDETETSQHIRSTGRDSRSSHINNSYNDSNSHPSHHPTPSNRRRIGNGSSNDDDVGGDNTDGQQGMDGEDMDGEDKESDSAFRQYVEFNRDRSDAQSMRSSQSGDLKRMEAFQSMQLFLDKLSEGTLDAVVIINDRGRILAVNDPALKMFGYRRWEIVGRNVRIICPPEIAHKHDKLIKRYIASKMKRVIGELRTDITARRKDGSQIPVVLKVSEIENAEIGQTAFYGILRDLSQETTLGTMTSKASDFTSPPVWKFFHQKQKTTLQQEATFAWVEFAGLDTASSAKYMAQLTALFQSVDTKASAYLVERLVSRCESVFLCCGLPVQHADHPLRVVEAVCDIVNGLDSLPAVAGTGIQFRAVVHSGRGFGGVREGLRTMFDVYGQDVEAANSMLDNCPWGTVLCSEATVEQTGFRHSYSKSPVSVYLPEDAAKAVGSMYAWKGRGRGWK